VSAEQLRQWLAECRVHGQTRVKPEGATEWQPLASLPEFAACVAPPPVLTPSPAAVGVVAKVIPYRNPTALVGYYCAVFALIPIVGILLGLAAFVLGCLGLRAARRNPAVGGKVHAWVAVVLGGVCGFGYLGLLIVVVSAAGRF